MDESTTTDAAVDSGTDKPVQPDTTDEQPSAETRSQESTTTSEDTQAAEDDNLAWLHKKGIDPTSPEALSKVAEMYRQSEKEMHQSTARASELERALSDNPQGDGSGQATDPNDVAALAAEVRTLRTLQTVNSFFTANPDAKQFEDKMTAIVTDNPTVGQLVQGGYLTIDQLYHMAKGGDSGHETQLKTEGGREALQRVADKQQAKAVVGAATTSALSSGSKDDPFLTGLKSES